MRGSGAVSSNPTALTQACSTPENADHNQYWFSTHTIETIIKARQRCVVRAAAQSADSGGAAQELEVHATRVAFVSTPSVYFSLAKGSALARSSMVFDVRPTRGSPLW